MGSETVDEEQPVKRSRFDQKEPEVKRSRFDRRSRSPQARRSETRDRSPLPKESKETVATEPAAKSPVDAASAAAEAAARINATLQARKGIQHVDVPPAPPLQISASPPPPPKAPTPSNKNSSLPEPLLSGEMYIADGDYIQDIEVNDQRNRYVVTKGQTQKMIKDETGADVTTRGSYFPDKALATPTNPPLYLHVTSRDKAGLELAVKKIHELITQDLPQLVDDRRLRRRDQETVERDEFGRRKWRVEKVPIDITPAHGFNLRAQIVGESGRNVKWIQQETNCRVQIKGRGSGFLERDTNLESDEDMYLSITSPDDNMIDRAAQLSKELVAAVSEENEKFKINGPPRRGGYGGRGGRGRGGYDHYGGPERRSSYDQTSYGQAAGTDQATADYYASWYAQQYANGQDPYAAYGGYEAYCAYYQQWYAQQQQGDQAAAPGTAAPPAQGNSATPPNAGAPGAPGAGAYSHQPPPPGL